MQNKKVIVSVINDLVTDQRVARTCSVLSELNYDVLLVGRQQKKSKVLEERNYKCKRLKLLFEQGPQFYLFFNIRLFFFLLFNKADALFSNDLDTLLPNYLVSKIKKIPLIYDSHEIFCEVPELQNNPFKKRIWEGLESWIVPKLGACITVNKSIANYFTRKYKVPFIFVRNIPNYPKLSHITSRNELDLPLNKKIIIMQGAGINVQRGAEELVESMQYLSDDYLLLIIGSGDVLPLLKEKVNQLNLYTRIRFIDKIRATELQHYTANANIGVTIDKDTNLNYHFSLPNKVFDYIYAGIPIIATKLPEIQNIVEHYRIGLFIENHQPKHIAEKISELLNSKNYLNYKANTIIASVENTWQQEKQKLVEIFNSSFS